MARTAATLAQVRQAPIVGPSFVRACASSPAEAEGDCSERRNARQAGVSLEITRAAPFGAALRCLLWLRGLLWLGSLRRCFFRLAHARRRGFWGAASLGFTLLEELQKRGLAPVTQTALVAFDDPRVAARPVLEPRSDLV